MKFITYLDEYNHHARYNILYDDVSNRELILERIH